MARHRSFLVGKKQSDSELSFFLVAPSFRSAIAFLSVCSRSPLDRLVYSSSALSLPSRRLSLRAASRLVKTMASSTMAMSRSAVASSSSASSAKLRSTRAVRGEFFALFRAFFYSIMPWMWSSRYQLCLSEVDDVKASSRPTNTAFGKSFFELFRHH